MEQQNTRAAIILAAGAGTRMKSDLPKVAHTCLGKPMVNWVIEAAKAAGITKLVAVVGHGRNVVEPLVAADCAIAVQEQRLGTAHAVLQAKDALKHFEGSVLVLSGDCPLITSDTLKRMADLREQQNAAVVVLTFTVSDPFGYGRIIRDEQTGEVLRIVEQKDASEQEASVKECNSGFYCFDARALFDALDQVGSDNAQGEFYLTDVLEISRKAGRRVLALETADAIECSGVNTPEQLANAQAQMQARVVQ